MPPDRETAWADLIREKTRTIPLQQSDEQRAQALLIANEALARAIDTVLSFLPDHPKLHLRYRPTIARLAAIALHWQQNLVESRPAARPPPEPSASAAPPDTAHLLAQVTRHLALITEEANRRRSAAAPDRLRLDDRLSLIYSWAKSTETAGQSEPGSITTVN